jgi:hypothetical protein
MNFRKVINVQQNLQSKLVMPKELKYNVLIGKEPVRNVRNFYG